ncbi:MAG TPA: DUF5808 domain-containing protein [Candidatus Anoxymicrobiaceae bacterium]
MSTKDRHGSFFGMIPYDFRKPTWSRLKRRMWNPAEEHIVVPRDFGIGWTLNLYRLREKSPWLFWILIASFMLVCARGLYVFLAAEDDDIDD